MGEYTVTTEILPNVYSELEPLYRAHYAQMASRLKEQGIVVAPYKPRLDEYFKAAKGGWFLTFVLRHSGKPVGYANMYVTSDMHNGETIAQEDVLFVVPEHRNGAWKLLYKHGMEVLRQRGCKRLSVSALTDLRVAKLWKRMGFKEVAVQMTYTF